MALYYYYYILSTINTKSAIKRQPQRYPTSALLRVSMSSHTHDFHTILLSITFFSYRLIAFLKKKIPKRIKSIKEQKAIFSSRRLLRQLLSKTLDNKLEKCTKGKKLYNKTIHIYASKKTKTMYL